MLPRGGIVSTTSRRGFPHAQRIAPRRGMAADLDRVISAVAADEQTLAGGRCRLLCGKNEMSAARNEALSRIGIALGNANRGLHASFVRGLPDAPGFARLMNSVTAALAEPGARLFESMKSEMRGAISARKREPLNTP